MENAAYLNKEDKKKLQDLQSELATLKAEHKKFAKNKNGLTAEAKEQWRLNSQRTNQVYIEIKELRLKNILEAGK
jgi:uncharacterized protein (DUF3084 family)